MIARLENARAWEETSNMSRDQKKAESRRRILDAARDVFFRDGRTYRQNMTLDVGPNRCFTQGAPGNDHAILITTASDDTGPSQPDAIVDCTVCGCEQTPS